MKKLLAAAAIMLASFSAQAATVTIDAAWSDTFHQGTLSGVATSAHIEYTSSYGSWVPDSIQSATVTSPFGTYTVIPVTYFSTANGLVALMKSAADYSIGSPTNGYYFDIESKDGGASVVISSMGITVAGEQGPYINGHDSVTTTEIYVKQRWQAVASPNDRKIANRKG